MKRIVSAAKLLPVFFTAILSSFFFLSLVLLDAMMKRKIPLYTRDAISHFVIIVIVLGVMYLLPGGPVRWGLNLKNWQRSLLLGIISGLALGILFSLFSFGPNLSQWNFANLVTQLRDRGNVLHLLSQIFLIGLSEELFFRGILVTYLTKQYAMKIIRIHSGVIIVSVFGASLQFYKILFGATLGNIFPFVIGGFLYFLVLGWMYQKTGSLVGPIITHNLCNSFIFLFGLGIQNKI